MFQTISTCSTVIYKYKLHKLHTLPEPLGALQLLLHQSNQPHPHLVTGLPQGKGSDIAKYEKSQNRKYTNLAVIWIWRLNRTWERETFFLAQRDTGSLTSLKCPCIADWSVFEKSGVYFVPSLQARRRQGETNDQRVRTLLLAHCLRHHKTNKKQIATGMLVKLLRWKILWKLA